MTINEVLILAALTQGSAHGYELMRRTGLSAPSTYRTLHRLAESNLVLLSRTQGRQRIYRITPRGMEACTAILNRISIALIGIDAWKADVA